MRGVPSIPMIKDAIEGTSSDNSSSKLAIKQLFNDINESLNDSKKSASTILSSVVSGRIDINENMSSPHSVSQFYLSSDGSKGNYSTADSENEMHNAMSSKDVYCVSSSAKNTVIIPCKLYCGDESNQFQSECECKHSYDQGYRKVNNSIKIEDILQKDSNGSKELKLLQDCVNPNKKSPSRLNYRFHFGVPGRDNHSLICDESPTTQNKELYYFDGPVCSLINIGRFEYKPSIDFASEFYQSDGIILIVVTSIWVIMGIAAAFGLLGCGYLIYDYIRKPSKQKSPSRIVAFIKKNKTVTISSKRKQPEQPHPSDQYGASVRISTNITKESNFFSLSASNFTPDDVRIEKERALGSILDDFGFNK